MYVPIGRDRSQQPRCKGQSQRPKVTFPPEEAPRHRISLTLSATNVSNRVNRTVVSGALTSPLFGQAVAANLPRCLYLGINTNF
jgi:hypothetical protein